MSRRAAKATADQFSLERKRAEKVRITAFLFPEAAEQLRSLQDLYETSQSATIAQAIARWYSEEPTLRKKANGAEAL